ncbi:MAG: hypothetical protein A2831_00545 [Candidatus Yanofskybacteria bacterium RIFCSPHIGHO2_01_FULL_44_17]|uniref:Glycosyltransferase 2-like domain-containing protein n=1 Tax=Candidatus Yanofskybacteria bacterium RIFCSPHIGHO2_01_FULL_44_17 TaxID=1802668 RepID=A0A1F8EXR1_9BACT|nr:MAG: hypothetical protein A2831_00545 [Candidatus Yanofskybacteria bacterium RIFCSPHIGHO2_01_FULL_44_17]
MLVNYKPAFLFAKVWLMLTNKKISVIVACYNDAGSVDDMYRRVTAVMAQITPNYEIIYVNDSSPDNAIEVLREKATRDSRFVVVDHARNFGADISYTSGLAVCTGDAAILLDGDIQDPPELFPEFVKKWLEGYEVVYGVRKKRKEGLLKRIGYKAYYRILKKMSYINIPLDSGNYGLMDRKVIDVLNSLPETDRFLRGLRAWAGFKSVGIPYDRDQRFSGQSASGLAIYIREAKRGIFSFSHFPIELITMLAIVMTCLTLMAIAAYIVLAIFYSAPKGFLTLLIIPMILASIQFLILAVIAEYVGRIFIEAKQRPKYVIREIINDPSKHRDKLGE